jgi:hypothetical protein
VKHIVLASPTYYPGFSFVGVSGADMKCESVVGSTYRAFIVDGVNRIASVSPFHGDGQVDWVLKKYMQYQNMSNQVIWTTDSTALLGVTLGTAGTLMNPIAPTDDGLGTWMGMNNDYTSGPDCVHWTANTTTASATGAAANATSVGQNFPNNGGTSDCATYARHLVCVEQ